MGHSQNDIAHAKLATALYNLFQRRYHGLTAIEAKTFGSGIFYVEKFLQAFGFDQFAQNGFFALRSEGDFLVRPFNSFLQPALGSRV